MSEKNASNAILKGVKYLISRELEKYPSDKTFTGLILNIKEDNLYDVLVQGKKYTNVPSMFKGIKVNDTVKIKSPQNQYSNMYIEGKLNMNIENSSGGGVVTSDVYWRDIIGKPDNLVQDSNYVHTDNNYTNEEKQKLSNLPETINKMQSDWNETDTSSESYIKNKPDSLPANGGNADTVGEYSVNNELSENVLWTSERIIEEIQKTFSESGSGIITGKEEPVDQKIGGYWYEII